MKSFLQIFENQTRLGKKIYVPDYLKSGKYPIVDQSRKEICGYTNDSEGLYEDVPIIIFGDVSRVIKYVDYPCFLGADGSVILKVIDNSYDTKYLYYYLRHQNIPNAGYNRHYKYLKDLVFEETPYLEQKKRTNVLEGIELLIRSEKQTIGILDESIKSRFREGVLEA